MDVLSMEWRNMLFAHWPFDPGTVEARLPDGLAANTYDDRAWVGIIAHRMADIRPRGSPIGRSFVEVNLRTYVRRQDLTGVYFFSLDAGDRLAVTLARRLWGLPYFQAENRIESTGNRYRVDSQRTHSGVAPARFRAEYGPESGASPPEADSLEAFLTDRYRLFTPSRIGLVTARLDRNPLAVAPGSVEIETESIFAASGLDSPSGDPRVLYGAPEGIRVRAGTPARLE